MGDPAEPPPWQIPLRDEITEFDVECNDRDLRAESARLDRERETYILENSENIL
jgi:hypothetical protein